MNKNIRSRCSYMQHETIYSRIRNDHCSFYLLMNIRLHYIACIFVIESWSIIIKVYLFPSVDHCCGGGGSGEGGCSHTSTAPWSPLLHPGGRCFITVSLADLIAVVSNFQLWNSHLTQSFSDSLFFP